MPRVNLDEEFFVDPRIDKLARICKEIRPLARGRLLAIYHHCYITRNPYKTAEEIDRYAEWDGDETYAYLMSKAGLASLKDHGLYRVSGVEKRITYLIGQSERGRRSAMTRLMKTGSSQPVPKKWKRPAALPPKRAPMVVENIEPRFEQPMQNSIEPRFEAVRTNMEISLCISSNQGSISSNQGSKPFEHLLSSNQLIQKPIIQSMNSDPRSFEEKRAKAQRQAKQLLEAESARSDGMAKGPPTDSLQLSEGE